MATEKEFKVKIDTSDVVTLQDNYKNLTPEIVKVISTQETLQSILSSPAPLKNIEKLIPVYQKIGAIAGGISQLMPRSVKQIQEVRQIIQNGVDKELENAKKISDAHKKKLDEINKEGVEFAKSAKKKEKDDIVFLDTTIQNLKRRGVETATLEALIKKRYKQTEEEITQHTLDNNSKRTEIILESQQTMTAEIDSNYEKQKSLLLTKYELEAQATRNATNLSIAAEDEKTAHIQYSTADREAATVAQYWKLKDLEEKKNENLKKLEEQHLKDKAAIFENFMKQRGEKMEVYVDDASNKIKKSTTKTANELGSFFQDVMMKDKSFTTDTINQIIDYSTKSQKTSADAAEAAKKAAAANKENAAATKETAVATNQATDATKKYIDIQATRAKYTDQINEYKSLQLVIQNQLLTQIDAFNAEIAAAGDNAEKRKEIEAKKLEFLKQTGAQLIAVQQEITTAQEKENNLSMKQMEQLAKKGEEIAGNAKNFTGKVADYFSTAFGSISNIYKAQIDSIDENLKQIKVKSEEYDAEEAARTAKKAVLADELLKAQKSNSTEAIKDIKSRIDTENELEANLAIDKRKLAEEQTKLELDKKKKQAEQEKIEKLKRKAELLKGIGEGIFNTAQGVTKTLGAYPFPFNIALASVVGAAGAAQVGIMTQQLAKFEDGGLLRGKRHTHGGMRIEGTNIEVEGGEYVINRESTHKNLGLVRYINSQRKELTPTDMNTFFAKASQGYDNQYQRMFATGGALPPVSAPEMSNEALVDAIKSIKFNFSPKVAVTDIIRAQEDAVQVNSWTGI